jgi:hypothetical protein
VEGGGNHDAIDKIVEGIADQDQAPSTPARSAASVVAVVPDAGPLDGVEQQETGQYGQPGLGPRQCGKGTWQHAEQGGGQKGARGVGEEKGLQAAAPAGRAGRDGQRAGHGADAAGAGKAEHGNHRHGVLLGSGA